MKKQDFHDKVGQIWWVLHLIGGLGLKRFEKFEMKFSMEIPADMKFWKFCRPDESYDKYSINWEIEIDDIAAETRLRTELILHALKMNNEWKRSLIIKRGSKNLATLNKNYKVDYFIIRKIL